MNAEDYHLSTELRQSITSELAYTYKVVPVSLAEDRLRLLSNNIDKALKSELEILIGRSIDLEYADFTEIEHYLSYNFRKREASETLDFDYNSDFIEDLLKEAQGVGGSDIHFEPYEHNCRVRFRIDGKLKEQYIINLQEYPSIINKIKIRASMDISEKRLPQDGRISLKSHQTEFDVRVSTLPTLHGEKIVLRILNKDASDIVLDDLGFSEAELKAYKQGIKKPNGIVLISGPTGSGKTTTLYATMKLLNDHKTNILTIEDPIEYTLEGINQVQLKENIGLDFPSTLRTFLRQDPDVIMIGEIRDVKTANMAIRAALTGHLVLSTIHTNSAWATVSRLVDMGIPGFLIASTLNITLAQRLVRKLCPDCKQSTSVDPKDFPYDFSIPKDLSHVYQPIGCQKCYQTGYTGRQAIYEIIPIDKVLMKSIKMNDLEVDDYIVKHNIVTLKENAIDLLKTGSTSVEEVFPLLIN